MNKNILLQGIKDYQGFNNYRILHLPKHILKLRAEALGDNKDIRILPPQSCPVMRQRIVTGTFATATRDFLPLETRAAFRVRSEKKRPLSLPENADPPHLKSRWLFQNLWVTSSKWEECLQTWEPICFLKDVHLHQLAGGGRVIIANGNSTSFTISLPPNLSTKCHSTLWEMLQPRRDGSSVFSGEQWNHLPWPGKRGATCMNYCCRKLARYHQWGRSRERSRGERSCQPTCPTNLPDSFSLASILVEQCVPHQEGPWVRMTDQRQPGS